MYDMLIVMIYAVGMEYLSREDALEGKPDEEILALSVSHPSLFAVLVRKYEEPFLRKAMSIVRGREEAEDVVQEAFTKIYLNAKKFKVVEGAKFSSWGYARAKRRGNAEFGLDEEIWALIPDKNLRQFERKVLLDEVASVLSRMPASLAKALGMFFLEGRTQEEIAKTEGLSVGAIKTRVHRAKAEFKRIHETINTKV